MKFLSARSLSILALLPATLAQAAPAAVAKAKPAPVAKAAPVVVKVKPAKEEKKDPNLFKVDFRIQLFATNGASSNAFVRSGSDLRPSRDGEKYFMAFRGDVGSIEGIVDGKKHSQKSPNVRISVRSLDSQALTQCHEVAQKALLNNQGFSMDVSGMVRAAAKGSVEDGVISEVDMRIGLKDAKISCAVL